MKDLFLLLTFALSALQVQAQSISYQEETADLDALYAQLDEAISESPRYVEKREMKIAACRDSLLKETNAERRLVMADKLFQLYRPYRNDSALHYADLCVSLSESLQRPDLVGRYRSLIALQCSNTGMEAESLEQLRKVNRSALDKRGLVDYYNAWMHVYGELASYSQRRAERQEYFDKQNLYRDSVMIVAPQGTEEWLHLKMDILTATRNYQDALSVSNRWLKSVKAGTHESAYAAFYRSMVFDHLGNDEMACYWLGKSALDDIRCAVMNQASLLFLAEKLANQGHLRHAMRYMEFSRECNIAFLPRLHTYQFNPVISIIEKSRQEAQDRSFMTLIIAGSVIVLLVLALIIVILRKRK